MQDLRKVFNDGKSEFVAADGINVDIPPGTITALLGPSGSGIALALPSPYHCVVQVNTAGSHCFFSVGKERSPCSASEPFKIYICVVHMILRWCHMDMT